MSAATPRFASVEALLDDARSRLDRLEPKAAADAVRAGALLVDIRPAWLRERTGEVPGAWVVERNHLEWRLHPDSVDRLAVATAGQEWVVLCQEGYTSSLAADALNSIGVNATDVVGGFAGWTACRLSTTAPPELVTGPDTVVGS